MGDSYETTGRSGYANLSEKEPHELLIQLGGALAIVLSVALAAIQWYQNQGIPANQLATLTTGLVINVVLGAALWVASQIVKKHLVNGALVAGILGVILIAFGGQSGVIAGVVGIFGAVLAIATPYMPKHRSR